MRPFSSNVCPYNQSVLLYQAKAHKNRHDRQSLTGEKNSEHTWS